MLDGGLLRRSSSNACRPRRRAALEQTVQAFQDTMAPFYAGVRAQDPSVFEQDLPFLHRIDMVNKWKAMDAETRKTVFEYLNHLATSAQMYGFYRGVPDAMLRKITDTAVNAAASGTMDVAAMAKSVMDEVDPAEMKSFAEALQNDPTQIASMLQTVSHMVGETRTARGLDPASGVGPLACAGRGR